MTFSNLCARNFTTKAKKQYKKTFSLFAIVLPFNFLHKTTDMLIWRYSFLILSRCTQPGFVPLRIATMCLSCDHWSFKDESMKKSEITWHQISWAFYFLIGQVYFMRQSTMKLPEKQIRQIEWHVEKHFIVSRIWVSMPQPTTIFGKIYIMVHKIQL